MVVNWFASERDGLSDGRLSAIKAAILATKTIFSGPKLWSVAASLVRAARLVQARIKFLWLDSTTRDIVCGRGNIVCNAAHCRSLQKPHAHQTFFNIIVPGQYLMP